MKASSVRNPNTSLLSIILVARYISATTHEPQRRQECNGCSIPVTSPMSTVTIIRTENPTAMDIVFDATGPVATVYITAQTMSNTEDGTVTHQYAQGNTNPTNAYSTGPQGTQTVDTTNSTVKQSVTPTAAATDRGSITIHLVTPAATSTAPAAGTSGTRSVGSRYTWSMSLILPWIAALLSR